MPSASGTWGGHRPTHVIPMAKPGDLPPQRPGMALPELINTFREAPVLGLESRAKPEKLRRS
jgi:hypothetical protein